MLQKTFFHRHLEEDETVSLVVHKHWLLGIKGLFWPTALLLLPWGLLALSHTKAVVYILLATSALCALWWLRNFFDYYLDAWIISDQAIIALQWKGWFHRESSRILFSDVHGISYEIHGIVGTVFRYGTVALEKISTGDAITIHNVAHPRSVEATILKNMEAYLHTKNMKNEKHVQEILAGCVAEHLQKEGMKPAKKKETAEPEKSLRKARSFQSSEIGSGSAG